MLKILASIGDKINSNAIEKEYQHTVYGIFSFVGFISFYFLNSKHNPGSYENVAIRLIAVALSLLLLLRGFWPQTCKKYLPIFWNVTLLYNLPFFCTFMLLKNNWDLQWQMNELMALTVLTILTDVITLSIIAPLGVFFASLLYYFTTENPTFPPNILGIILNYLTVFIFCALFTFKKDMFFQERLKFHNKIQELNDSLEQKIKDRTLELEEALAAKTEFLNNMSHEIRTPIQGFTVLSEGLVAHWNSFTEVKKLNLASQVATNARRLASLVANLLDLSKFNASKMIMDFREISLNDLILSIISECKELYLDNKKIEINFDEYNEAVIQADENRLSQVLRNLLVNAIKFTPENGKIDISLKKTTLNNNRALHFIISDSGMGVPEDEIEDIFEPFVQSSLTKTKAGGTGLGLSICKQIIKAHRGKIWAKNNRNAMGASFHFVIPCDSEKNIGTSVDHAASVDAVNNKGTILMIDDEDVCLSSMELLVLNTSYSLVKSRGGAAGLAYLKANANKVDVVLLDLMMPDIYGLTILEEIRKDPALADIPVILQSGTSDQVEIQKAYAIGISSFISKPYEKEVVIEEISKALQMRSTSP